MPWTWVRPADPSLLDGRPLLDLGTGDGQTLAALVRGPGLVVGVDRSAAALRAAGRASPYARVCAQADRLPFTDASFTAALAGDLFHHLVDRALASTLAEVVRVLRPGGRLLAWWYERSGRPGPDAPAYPRRFAAVQRTVLDTGFRAAVPVELEFGLEPAPATIGLLAEV